MARAFRGIIGSDSKGEIIEDRGNLGYGGVQIVRVAQPDQYSGEIEEFEVPEDEVELVEA